MDSAVAALGVLVRAGICASEVGFVDGQRRGVGVRLAGQLAALAAPGEVFVSSNDVQ
jgi:hypothetical protein